MLNVMNDCSERMKVVNEQGKTKIKYQFKFHIISGFDLRKKSIQLKY